MDPPTAASFTIERVDRMTPGEMHVLGGIVAPGVCMTIRNDAPRATRFRAQIEETRDVDELREEIAHIVERDWAAAYDRARRNA
jgi:hypothetical protein